MFEEFIRTKFGQKHFFFRENGKNCLFLLQHTETSMYKVVLGVFENHRVSNPMSHLKDYSRGIECAYYMNLSSATFFSQSISNIYTHY